MHYFRRFRHWGGISKGSLLHTRSLWVFGKARWLLGAILFVLGTLGTLLGVPALGNQLRTDVPGLRCWFPAPMDNSKFTIVMSPFVTVNRTGRMRTTHDGRELARLLYTRLESGFEGLNLAVPYELRSPDQSCPIKGATREDRAAAAEAWANRIDADVVIYGAIVQEAESAQLQPEFYVAYRGFTQASELVGPHELGRPLRVAMPVQPQDLEGVDDHPLNVRAKALSLIALGLASYAVDDYEQALTYFTRADEVPNWPESAGKEMLYFLMGITSSRLAATTLNNAYVDEALDYFDHALEIEPAFARALVGQASALYQLALGNFQSRKASEVDLGLLDEAEALFRQAAITPAPEAAEIELKIHLGLGQLFLVRHYLQVEGDDWLAQARSEFQTVVDLYTAGGVRNRDVVGHAYARLGLIANQFDQDTNAAIPLYVEAAALATPRWQAQYLLDLGDLYATLNDVENARHSFEEAQAVAELYGNEEMVERADARLAALR
jgi:tetratricopeptide (TPR) repeat protein